MPTKEKMINGVLCHRVNHRDIPNQEWTQYTIEALSTAYIAMESEARKQKARADKLETRLAKIIAAIKEVRK